MKQVVQRASGGRVRVEDVPRPVITSTEVLVRTEFTVVSSGTEGAMTKLARANLLNKAKARPDLVRKVLAKAKTDGLQRTLEAVRSRLDEDIPLGYSGAGTVVAVGDAVEGVLPGQSVATGGAGKANHAEYQAVPGMLCVPVPAGVTTAEASFGTIASVALHGLRLAEVGPGAHVVVIGLGLVGQIAARLAVASGCMVTGLDVAAFPIERAKAVGINAVRDIGSSTTRDVLEWTRGRGADAVLVTAGGRSSTVMSRTPPLCRDRATVVVVGDVGLNLERAPYYEKELLLRFSRSYGPGRYERTYEDWGVDYPVGYVRWTEGRNLETVLDLIASQRLGVIDLVTQRFDIADAPEAYELIEEAAEPYLAIQLQYPPPAQTTQAVKTTATRTPPSVLRSNPVRPGVGLIGAGAFTKTILLPAMRRAGFDNFVSVASASGRSAKQLAEKEGFLRIAATAEEVMTNPDVDLVVITSPHSSHADFVVESLAHDKHVFVEKPLAVQWDDLKRVESAFVNSQKLMFVGFNRRWSRPVNLVRDLVDPTAGPLVITYRVNAGPVSSTHWYKDRREGGRLIGEVCHFVDTCLYLVGSDIDTAMSMAAGKGELLLNDNLAVTLHFPDGSLAVITYADAGHASTPKEHIEILGRGHSAWINNFAEVGLNGDVTKIRPQDKGHDAQMRALLAAIRQGGPQPHGYLETSRATLVAAAALSQPRSVNSDTSGASD